MILIVEDNAILCFWYEMALKNAKLTYHIAKTGKSAISIFQKNEVGLILCDFLLPDMDGYTLCQKLRQIEEQEFRKRAPIFIVSAEEEKKMNTCASLDGWLMKPLSGDQLNEILKSYLANTDSDTLTHNQ